MGNELVKEQLESTVTSLKETSLNIRTFLNQETVESQLKNAEGSSQEEIELLFDQLRRLLVYFDEGMESGQLLLKSEKFRKTAAEKTLFWVFHQCVEEFFQPHYDVWYEDSRAAYTGKNAIHFRTEVSEQLKKLIRSIEGPLQEMREDLDYYETDFRTRLRQQESRK
ncbi:YpuI family protein [Salisediminibacterium selenitireducens]|uniref:DUF3907 domain-containing protein n=1 Tax=Bacillus selenitireducens (strain ATCC 700615 / DSM 15326 / MLS10) TaxID=439292 RepID=D6XVE9_BACIE|nr:YpuI family protein [Salisediminibacterium selenitireducens]ADH99687.1 hypothetical protein Bsel_2183 [[Bacillus] selenitireducens MLS10]